MAVSSAAISPRAFSRKIYARAAALQEPDTALLRRAGVPGAWQARVAQEIVYLKIFTADFIIQSTYGGDPRTRLVLDHLYGMIFRSGRADISVVDMMPRFVLYTDAARGLKGSGGRSRDIGEEFSGMCDDFLPEGMRVRMARLGASVHRATSKFVHDAASLYVIRDRD